MVSEDRKAIVNFKYALGDSGLYLDEAARWDYVTRSIETYAPSVFGTPADERGSFEYSKSPLYWALGVCAFLERRADAGIKEPVLSFAKEARSDARKAMENRPVHIREADLKRLESAATALLDQYGK
jgi:hypothetical protein